MRGRLTSKNDRVRELFLLQSHPHTTSRKTYETFSCEPFSFGAFLPGAQRILPTNLSLFILLSDAAHSPRAELVVLDVEGRKCRHRVRCRRRWWNHAGSVQSKHPPPSHVEQLGYPASVRCSGRPQSSEGSSAGHSMRARALSGVTGRPPGRGTSGRRGGRSAIRTPERRRRGT